MESSGRSIKYPVVGISSMALGYLITNLSTFNIHNFEGIIWALMMLGLEIILPTSMFIKSIRLLADKQGAEKNKVSIVLTSILGLLLISMLVAMFYK